jgi:hypothetical protein
MQDVISFGIVVQRVAAGVADQPADAGPGDAGAVLEQHQARHPAEAACRNRHI